MNYINLTPHVLNVHNADGSVTNIAPSGEVARVAVEYVKLDPGVRGDIGIDVFKAKYGVVTGLPKPREGCIFIVSGMVASSASRFDVFSPGDLVRDENGKPCGCKGLKTSF